MTEAEEIAASDPVVQELKKPPDALVAPLHGWARVRRVLRAVLQGIGMVALAVALYGLHAQGRTATCVNDTLASRNTPTQGVPTDAQAHIDFARSLDGLLNAPKAQQRARVTAFKAEVQAYAQALAANQAARDAHPLGRC